MRRYTGRTSAGAGGVADCRPPAPEAAAGDDPLRREQEQREDEQRAAPRPGTARGEDGDEFNYACIAQDKKREKTDTKGDPPHAGLHSPALSSANTALQCRHGACARWSNTETGAQVAA